MKCFYFFLFSSILTHSLVSNASITKTWKRFEDRYINAVSFARDFKEILGNDKNPESPGTIGDIVVDATKAGATVVVKRLDHFNGSLHSFMNGFMNALQDTSESLYQRYENKWEPKLIAFAKTVDESVNGCKENLDKPLDVPGDTVADDASLHATLKDSRETMDKNFATSVTNPLDGKVDASFEKLGGRLETSQTLEKAKAFATDVTKPLDEKVDDSLKKAGARSGTNLERESDSTEFFENLILGIFLFSVLCLIMCVIIYAVSLCVIARIQCGKVKNVKNGGLRPDGRKLPRVFDIRKNTNQNEYVSTKELRRASQVHLV